MGKQWKQWLTFLFWGAPKSLQMVTAAMKLKDTYSLEEKLYQPRQQIKECLLLGRKAMTNLDSLLKCRDITLLTNVHLVKTTVFPVVMYGLRVGL